MIKYFKKLKDKFYYSYIDKIINSPENIERAVKLENENNVQLIEIQNEHIPVAIVVQDLLAQDAETASEAEVPEKKKPGRPKSTAEKKPAPVKKGASKAKAKPKPKSE